MTREYIKHFADQSDHYLQFRPTYPDALYVFLYQLTKKHDLAWDCATGNGQAAAVLATYFKEVIATDINQSQLDIAIKVKNVQYHCWPAEKTELQDASVDLITVAQALHWFDLSQFYQEVKRVLKPDGVIAAWCYSLGSITPEIDIVIKKLYYDILGEKYWPKERHYIDDAYQTILFPFKKIETPTFIIEKSINLQELIGYLNTWSAVKEYQKHNHINPIDSIFSELHTTWGNPESEKLMRWPLSLLAGVLT